jgi:hypothetical protein
MMMGKLSFSLSHARVETYAVYAVVQGVFSTLRPVHPRVTKHPKAPRYCIINAPGLRVVRLLKRVFRHATPEGHKRFFSFYLRF